MLGQARSVCPSAPPSDPPPWMLLYFALWHVHAAIGLPKENREHDTQPIVWYGTQQARAGGRRPRAPPPAACRRRLPPMPANAPISSPHSPRRRSPSLRPQLVLYARYQLVLLASHRQATGPQPHLELVKRQALERARRRLGLRPGQPASIGHASFDRGSCVRPASTGGVGASASTQGCPQRPWQKRAGNHRAFWAHPSAPPAAVPSSFEGPQPPTSPCTPAACTPGTPAAPPNHLHTQRRHSICVHRRSSRPLGAGLLGLVICEAARLLLA